MDDGLSNYKVNTICKDNLGFVWFGTNEGLNRFDGFDFKIYKTNPNDNLSISSNTIRKITRFGDHKLVIGTNNGADIFDLEKETFEHVKLKDSTKKINLTWAICVDSNNTIWLGSMNGLFFKKPNKKYASNFSDDHEWYNNYEVTELFITKENEIIIGTKQHGIFIYNQKNNRHKMYSNNPEEPRSISGNWIEAIYKDNNGDLWIGTNDHGLNLLRANSERFEKIHFTDIHSDNIRVRDIKEDAHGNIWVGTYLGLFVRFRTSKSFIRYAHFNDPVSRLSNNSIYDIYLDNNQMLWTGTYSGGVNYCDMGQKEFKVYEYKKDDQRYLNDRVVYSIVEDENECLWIGTERGGLNKLNRKTGVYEYFNLSSSGMHGNNIKVILPHGEKQLWLGTYKTGLLLFDKQKGIVKRYLNSKADSNSICSNIVYSLIFDKNENLWIGTRNGIDLLPKGGTKFKHFKIDVSIGNKYSEDIINILFSDSKDNIWAGTALYGLLKFDRTDSAFKQVKELEISRGIYSIHEDTKGNLWIAGDQGLFHLDLSTLKVKHYSEKDGLPITSVYSIADDQYGNLWLSTTNGISKFENAINSPHSAEFLNFSTNDGIFINQFTINANNQSQSDEIFFGGIGGFVSFFPTDIKRNYYPPKIRLTSFKVFDNDVKIGQALQNKVILSKSITTTGHITLSHKHKVFTIEFAALHYSNSQKNQYKYKLEGFDKDWHYTNFKKRSATYTNLNGGKYTFIVAASNNDGAWAKEPLKLKIFVQPPIWETWYFYSLLVGLTLLIFYFIARYRTTKLELQKKKLELMVEERTNDLVTLNVQLEEKQREISKQNTELANHRSILEQLVYERTKELEEQKQKAEESEKIKTAFLANMSHEIRTPMNAILGFSSLLVREGSEKSKKRYAQIINHNTELLLVLVNDILDLSKIESHKLLLFKTFFDAHTVLYELANYYNLKMPAEVKLSFDTHQESLILYTDIVRFKQIITNLMDNAVKYTERGSISFGYKTNESEVTFFVKDTGIGISKEKFNSIFNFFQKIDDNKEKLYRGAGVGLSLSKKLTNMLGGDIWLESELGLGSSFYFTLPYSKDFKLPDSEELNEVEDIQIDSDKYQVIIAEDEEHNFYLLKTYLQKLNIAFLFWAKNGREVVDFVRTTTDTDNLLILMDIKMPVLDGIKALEIIKDLNPRISVIAITAYATIAEKESIVRHNFNAYLPKPLKLNDLSRAISQLN